MAIIVYTESVCEKCALIVRVPRVESQVPAPGWGTAVLTKRSDSDKDMGWTNSRSKHVVLCPDCLSTLWGSITAQERR